MAHTIQLYNQTDRQLHFLSQIIAKANRTFIPAKKDDSHTNLYFDNIGSKIIGRWIKTENSKLLFSLNLNSLNFELLDEAFNVKTSIPTISKLLPEIENELENAMVEIGLKPEGFKTKLHYEIPEYDFVKKPVEAANPVGLKNWKETRTLANEACTALLGYAQLEGEIRIWPHHFDTGIYFKPKNKLGVGFGLAMQDEMAKAPYFYIAAYPKGIDIDYKNLPQGPWKWEIGEYWKGAYLTLKELEKQSLAHKKEIINNYLKAIYDWIILQS